MYELNRVRLFGMGPRGARFGDVVLDLSGVGAPIGSGSLFEAPPRRPSPYSLLMLENGGGKSVLLKLVFSVMLPGKRNTLGGSSDVLEKFVVGEEAGHVVLEWMHVKSAERVITGKTYQWRRTSNREGSKLGEAWWSLRPRTEVELDTLPFALDGRRLRMDGFKEALEELDRVHPTTQLAWLGSNQGEWVEHLRSLGIEPDLFSIQRRMNADEGDAANAFQFKSSKEFVDWLLTVVLDPADAVSVAENFDSYTVNIGDRAAMLLEREFTEGAVSALRPAGEAHGRTVTARAELEQTELAARDFVAAVTARHLAEQDEAQALRSTHSSAATEASARESDRDRARDAVNEIRRQTLSLALALAEKDHENTGREQAAIDRELAAWAACEAVQVRDQAVADAQALAQRLADAEEGARPALAARDAAAAGLLAKLHDEVDKARTDATVQDGAAAQFKKDAKRADQDRTDALVAEERARSGRKSALEEVAEIGREVERATVDGLLSAGEDVPTAAAAARAQATRLATALTTAETDSNTLASSLESADALARRTTIEVARLEQQRDGKAQQLQDVTDRAVRLGADDVILAALAVATLDANTLDASADALASQLADDIATREERLDALRAEQREDQRVLNALGNGGLLPARAEVEAAIEVLDAAGIAAHPGWRYLAQNAPTGERATLVATHPEIADGIVLIDSAQLPRARVVLETARLLPAAAITVDSGATLLIETEQVSSRYVIEPNPAMFDEDAAELRRLALRDGMARRGDQITPMSTALLRTRDVVAELAAWRRACPAGRLAELAEELGTLEALVETAREQQTTAETEASTLRERISESTALTTELRAAERAAAETANALEQLAARVERATVAQRRAIEHQQTAEAAHRKAIDAKAVWERALEKAEEAARAAENSRDRASRHLAAAEEVVTSSGEVSSTVPSESLLTLRQVYAAASDAYRKVEVGHDLRAEAERAAIEAARRRGEAERLPPDLLTEAEQLLATAAGADRAGREAAIARANREKERLRTVLSTAAERVGQLTSELRQASPADRDRNVWIVLPDERRPTTVQHGYQLLEDAQAQQRDAQEALDNAVRHAADLHDKAQNAGEAARDFREALVALEAGLDDSAAHPTRQTATAGTATDTVASYDKSVETAREQAQHLRSSLRDARATEAAATRKLHSLIDAVVRYASEPRFEAMTNVARRAIISLGREHLGVRVAEFADQLAQRLATLDTDLDSASKHRKLIVDRLAALTEGALKTLRTASRLSRLPSGMGEWEGKEFLRIRFADPDPSLLVARIGELVDELAAATANRKLGNRGSASKRDGMTLLLRSAEAAVPKGFTVDVLKPDAVLRDERVAVEQMNDVFSGGQELTAAIILYCTMAALRANERGQMRTRHSGVLFLDNPIGKASATYLLDLQQGVAAALGVQLIYTTGLSDDRALAAFPLWIRMRNDADLRAGLKYIRVAEIVRAQLPDPFDAPDADSPTSAPGAITAARVYRRRVTTE
ncbi:hypothetical protein [Kitasatospora sp. NPDC097643]|uniref:hypothetical protein n=1 Tax=Kitasatospora sp. NPDC097643 TaxID=3157230 RepID=UPI0033283714